MPVYNHTKHDITLPNRTELDSIQHITKVIDMGKLESEQGEKPSVQAIRVEVNVTTSTLPPADLWQPPVNLSHHKPNQQQLEEEMLHEESGAFAQDSSDFGCIPSPQMTTELQDDIPVLKVYASIPKPLYKEAKEYIHELLLLHMLHLLFVY